MCATIYGGMASKRWGQEAIDRAKVLWLKGEGDPNGLAAQIMVPIVTLRSWAIKYRWGPFGGETSLGSIEVPTLEAVLVLFEKKARQSNEDAYDEALRNIAYAVPFFIRRLNVLEIIEKADKVARLVDLSRKILGRDEPRNGRNSTFSVNFLAGGAIPPRTKQVELIEEQALAPAGS
jgi:hypothetical protein